MAASIPPPRGRLTSARARGDNPPVMSDATAGGETPRGIGRGLTDYGDPAFSLFIRGAYARGAGLTREDLLRPIIGIAQTWSEFNPCHRHLREVAEAVKRGVLQAGGPPPAFPATSSRGSSPPPAGERVPNLWRMVT